LITYYEAVKAKKAFEQYRTLTLNYWHVKPKYEPSGYEWMAGGPIQEPESEQSMALRDQLSRAYPSVSIYSQRLGVPTSVTSYPPPAFGGPVFNIDMLNSVVNQHIDGRGSITRVEIMDAINKCIGAAELAERNLLWKQALNPIYYLAVILGFVLRIPFMMLQQAGIPKEVENTVWGHAMKFTFFIMLLIVCARYGLKISVSDLLPFLK